MNIILLLSSLNQMSALFTPGVRADFTLSGLLRRVRGERPQLHPPRLPSKANSTREYFKFTLIIQIEDCSAC